MYGPKNLEAGTWLRHDLDSSLDWGTLSRKAEVKTTAWQMFFCNTAIDTETLLIIHSALLTIVDNNRVLLRG